MSTGQVTAHPPVMDQSAGSLTKIASDVSVLNHPIDPPNIAGGVGAHTGGAIAFPAAAQLLKAFATRQKDMLDSVGKHATAIDVMAKALSQIAADYGATAQGDKASAARVQQAIDAVTKPSA